MPAQQTITNFVLLPELEIIKTERKGLSTNIYWCRKKKLQEYCPYCASGDYWTHEYRVITVKDAPIRGKEIILKIRKRRLRCKSCFKTFNEPINGILPKKRFTQRFKRGVLWACENYKNLKRVKKAFRCSNQFIYDSLYETLELNRRRNLNYAWPKTIGIDEHAFGRSVKSRRTRFCTMLVDFVNKRPFELVEGRSGPLLWKDLAHIPGRENVTHVALDLSDPYKKFVSEFFPNAEMVADKFHVLRLLNHHIMRRRKEITGDRASKQARDLLLMSNINLGWKERKTLWEYLDRYPELKEVYAFKESLHSLYRIRGYNKASKALTKLTDRMAKSNLKEIKTLRATLVKWRDEILNYFKTRITNARTEGFNHIAKLLKRNAFGFKSFPNYRLRVLNAAI
ncbi:MAG: ISL3 family transposase [Bdellovibrionales bacterium]|nr:ISL3 family transposase [Bdellovibrionales bacterium]